MITREEKTKALASIHPSRDDILYIERVHPGTVEWFSEKLAAPVLCKPGDYLPDLVYDLELGHRLGMEPRTGILMHPIFRRLLSFLCIHHLADRLDLPDLLDALGARSVPIAVLSNKPDEFTRACVAHLLPRWSFSAVLGAGEQVPRKPDPSGAVAIAARLGVSREAVLFLGDGPTDVLAALAAGMVPVGALWGFRSEAELRAAGARLLLHHPLELLSLL